MINSIFIIFLLFFVSGCNNKFLKNDYNLQIQKNDSVIELNEEVVDTKIFFDVNKFDLTTDAKSILLKQVTLLKLVKAVDLIVEGHCDERGTREYNLALGERRAESVKAFLISCGINSQNIYTVSYGKEKPDAFGNNEEAWNKNRRAVIIINNK